MCGIMEELVYLNYTYMKNIVDDYMCGKNMFIN
jgi:hypothetical protein